MTFFDRYFSNFHLKKVKIFLFQIMEIVTFKNVQKFRLNLSKLLNEKLRKNPGLKSHMTSMYISLFINLKFNMNKRPKKELLKYSLEPQLMHLKRNSKNSLLPNLQINLVNCLPQKSLLK